MYEELVKDLREKAEFLTAAEPLNIKNAFAETMKQAADAIENTSKAYQMMAEAYEAEVTKSRWIPVTERLPEAAPGDVSERVLVTDGKDVAIVEWFNFEECEPFWGYSGFCKDVTHWAPLPEPPKEENK